MKIAVIGGGISGLSVARLLHQKHDIRIFEAGERPGGHSNTVTLRRGDRDYSIDTGFIVFNDRTYPQFLRLLSALGVEGVPTSMSFAVRSLPDRLEYCGSSLGGLFAQKRNLLRPRFLKMIRDILRFNREGTEDADSVPEDQTVGEYLSTKRYGGAFRDLYLLPMGAAIWSCPTGTFARFPIRFILEFYRHHGLLSLKNRPQWYTIRGGSQTYVEKLVAPFQEKLRLGCPVRNICRTADGVSVVTETGSEQFDEVVLACHSDQALKMLDSPSEDESTILSGFPYEANEVLLHTDTRVLPERRQAWAAWNYLILPGKETRPVVSYNMNILQHIQSDETFSVTLNAGDRIPDEHIISRHRYSHPVFTTQRRRLQQRHEELIRRQRTSYCGAYWGNGFHEDGVQSAVRVAAAFGCRDF